MGAVFYATDLKLNRPVALKVIRPDVINKRGILARFKREIKLLAQLSHPSIVEIYDVGTSDGTMYFSMEYIEGMTLGQLIKKGPVNPRRAVTIIKKLAEALREVHGLKILHRDIKPANVILTKNDVPKLMDFGLAKQDSETQTALTKTGSIVGTFSYTAPEILRGQPASECSDVYQLGCILYRMLTQASAIPRDMIVEAARNPKRVVIDKPSELVDGIDDALDVFTLRTCHPDKDSRTKTATRLVEDCQNWLNNKKEVVKSRKVSSLKISRIVPPKTKPKKKVRLPFILAMIAALLVTIAAVYTLQVEENTGSQHSSKTHLGMTIIALRKQLLLKPRDDLITLQQLGRDLRATGIAERLGIPKKAAEKATGLYYMVIYCRKKRRLPDAMIWYRLLIKEYGLTAVEEDGALFLAEIEECAASAKLWRPFYKIMDDVLKKDAVEDKLRALVAEKAAMALLESIAKDAKSMVNSVELERAVTRLQPYLKDDKKRRMLCLRLLATRGGSKSREKFEELLAPFIAKLGRPNDVDVPWIRRAVVILAYGWDANKKELNHIHELLNKLEKFAKSDNERARILATRAILSIRLPTDVAFNLPKEAVKRGVKLAEQACSLQAKADVHALAKVAHGWAILHRGERRKAWDLVSSVKMKDMHEQDQWIFLRVRGGIYIERGRSRAAIKDHELALQKASPELRTYMRVVLGSTNVKAAFSKSRSNALSDGF